MQTKKKSKIYNLWKHLWIDCVNVFVDVCFILFYYNWYRYSINRNKTVAKEFKLMVKDYNHLFMLIHYLNQLQLKPRQGELLFPRIRYFTLIVRSGWFPGRECVYKLIAFFIIEFINIFYTLYKAQFMV
jgi:hypothetical protein